MRNNANNTDSEKLNENAELNDLATHSAGAVNLHKTRHSKNTVQIDQPVVPNPGPYDTRTGAFERDTGDSN